MRHLVVVHSPSSSAHRSTFGEPPVAEDDEAGERSQLDDITHELARLGRDVTVEQAVELGRLVIERLHGGDISAWRSRGPKTHSLRAMARRGDLPVSSSALYRAIALYELSVDHGSLGRWTSAGLGISHLRLVFGLATADQRRLLDDAVHNGWTVADLERAAVATRKRSPKRSPRGGRPRLPRFVKSVNRLCKAAEAPNELFGDLEAAADMSPERLAEIRDMLATIRVRCAELDRALERATAGG